ncbi:MAG TPA: urea ABC transporter permease subunit UrtB [Candidatus Hydrogenedentes bacterium]|nr:urea ABC transporter permease subunit UrtB [Candidatus Hydrogenedentota bacterium]HIO20854.1 urea ABC transporter permease subunit UrtB [Nitrospirales bacterium]HIO69171.1 urea ABC transporter permease subunit UrtB [Nitrospirales bacterium]
MKQIKIISPFILALVSTLGLNGCSSDEPQQRIASSGAATATIRELLLELGNDDSEIVRTSITALANTGDQRIEVLMEFYRQGSLYILEDSDGIRKVVLCEEVVENEDLDEFAPLSDPLSGVAGVYVPIPSNGEMVEFEGVELNPDQLVVPIEDLEEIDAGRKERNWARSAKFLSRLSSPVADIRLSGAKKCGDPPEQTVALDRLRELAENDPISKIRRVAQESVLLIQLRDADEDVQFAAVEGLAALKSLRALPRLEDRLKSLRESHEDDAGNSGAVQTEHTRAGALTYAEKEKAYKLAISIIAGHQRNVGMAENLFRGLSLGSILIMMALGLAITFGLMGVINMAHGELMMIGAYATYEMQLLFSKLIEQGKLPEAAFGYYYALALPFAFLCAAMVGYIMELVVISRLYRKPLESLLATWGIGLILIQCVRIRYGDNIGVSAPDWARGSIEIVQDFNMPWGRLFIIGLTVLSVVTVYGLMYFTRIGLQMRATMQNRDMASSLGVNTKRIDAFTFAFGSGLAGVAGYAVTLIGGVTPDMGQQVYIVDSFLVVVTGGVGEIAGVICSGLGIGVLTKFIEPGTGTIWAKIILLVLIVGFMQFRPSGLFAPKGRLADD